MKLTTWFCADDDEELRDLILGFSNNLGSPIFLPHITLLGSVEIEEHEEYCDAVQLACSDIDSLKIDLKGIGYEDLIWRCFYYKAFPKATLFDYHVKLAMRLAHFGATENPDYIPHLSLIYDNLNNYQQEVLLQKYSTILSQKSLVFNTIKVVHFVPDDIENWTVLSSFQLPTKSLSK